MKRLSDLEMMDYLDGALALEQAAAVEAHLAQNAEDAQLLADLKLAQSTLHEMSQSEPIRARDDFWQKVRAELPEPQKAPSKSLLAQIGGWLWPSHSPMGMSLRVAVLAAFLAMMATWFGPGQIRQTSMAGNTASGLRSEQKPDVATRVPPKRDAKPLPGAANSDAGAETDN